MVMFSHQLSSETWQTSTLFITSRYFDWLFRQNQSMITINCGKIKKDGGGHLIGKKTKQMSRTRSKRKKVWLSASCIEDTAAVCCRRRRQAVGKDPKKSWEKSADHMVAPIRAPPIVQPPSHPQSTLLLRGAFSISNFFKRLEEKWSAPPTSSCGGLRALTPPSQVGLQLRVDCRWLHRCRPTRLARFLIRFPPQKNLKVLTTKILLKVDFVVFCYYSTALMIVDHRLATQVETLCHIVRMLVVLVTVRWFSAWRFVAKSVVLGWIDVRLRKSDIWTVGRKDYYKKTGPSNWNIDRNNRIVLLLVEKVVKIEWSWWRRFGGGDRVGRSQPRRLCRCHRPWFG